LRSKLKYGDIPNFGDEARNWLSDYEHNEIMVHRIEGTPQDRHRTSMHKIGEDINRSPQTVNRHIRDHNKEIAQRGYCIKCRRVKGRYTEHEV